MTVNVSTKQNVPAVVVWRLHKALMLPLPDCKRFLALFTPVERERFVAAVEQGRGPRFFHDPVEYDPKLRDKILAAREEVKRQVEREHQQRVAEQQAIDPDFTPRLGCSAFGIGHGYTAALKQLLYQRHAIVWFTPAEIYARMSE